MIKRIIIVHWNRQSGPEPIMQYPPEKSFPKKNVLLKIWSQHELTNDSIIEFYSSDENQQGYISIMQQHGGELYYLLLVQEKSEFIGNLMYYSDILAIISKNLIGLLNTNKITRALFEAFNTIKNYGRLEKEENLLNFFTDKIKFIILEILREGVISKSELINILKKEHGFSPANIDLLIISFIREQMIIKRDVPGRKDDYFLIRDLFLTRMPPKNLFSLVKGMEEEDLQNLYVRLLSIYHDSNFISDINEKILINFLMNKDVFTLIKKLRTTSLLVIECLNLLNNNEDLFNELIENKIIYENKGNVYLISDLRFIKFTPYYLLNKLLKRYYKNEISSDELFIHADLLVRNQSEYEIV
ncbi:MAG: hypothetical protein ACTSXH_01195 [Promethearchaeota archaeon]